MKFTILISYYKFLRVFIFRMFYFILFFFQINKIEYSLLKATYSFNEVIYNT